MIFILRKLVMVLFSRFQSLLRINFRWISLVHSKYLPFDFMIVSSSIIVSKLWQEAIRSIVDQFVFFFLLFLCCLFQFLKKWLLHHLFLFRIYRVSKICISTTPFVSYARSMITKLLSENAFLFDLMRSKRSKL